jgi:hypothetical protein
VTTRHLLSTTRYSVVESCIFSRRNTGIGRLLLFNARPRRPDGTHFPSLMTASRCLTISGRSYTAWFAEESFGSTIQIGTFFKKSPTFYATSIPAAYVTATESHDSLLVVRDDFPLAPDTK